MHNIVKSFFTPTKTNASERQPNNEEELCISHLKRVFENYKNGRHQLEPVLPSFCKAFKSARAPEINDKFPEIADFAKCVSAELVYNITKTASSKSLEEGSLALLQLIKSSQWNGLCTVNIAALSLSAVKMMCCEHLPSTLVKMLYLFMDLPHTQNDEESIEKISTMLMSVLIRMGEHVCVVEELKTTDSDLLVLFDICTSWWPPHNLPWQKCAVEFMTTICRKSLTHGIVEYLDVSQCIGSCIKNLRYMVDTNVICTADTILPLFGCLKDSCTISDKLLNAFRDNAGYILLTDAILNLEKFDAEETDELKRIKNGCLDKLAYSVPQLCTAGFEQVIPEIHAKCMQYQGKDFCIPTPTGKGASVKNPAVFSVLQNVFMRCEHEHTAILMLDAINSVYRLDEVNYFILSQHNTLNCFIAEKLVKSSTTVQERILKMVEHVVFVLRYIPSSELEALAILLKDSPQPELAEMILKTLNKLLTANSTLKEVLLQLGLLNSLQFCHIQLLQMSQNNEPINDDYLVMLMTTLNTMLENCYPCYTNYVESHAREFLYDMLHVSQFRSYVLHVIKTLSTYESINDDTDDVKTLLRIIQENPTKTDLKLDVLDCLSELFLSFPLSQQRFQAADGFLFISNLLVSAEEHDKEGYMGVVGKVLSLLQSALHANPANMYYFEHEVEYSSLTKSLELLPCLAAPMENTQQEDTVLKVFKFLMTLALDLEQDLLPREAKDTVMITKHEYLVLDMEYYDRSVVYPHVITTILILAHVSQSDRILGSICEWVMQMTLQQHNLQLLSDVKLVSSLLQLFPHVFTDTTHPAHDRVVSLFEVLARHKLYPDQLRTFLRLDSPLYCARPETTTEKVKLDQVEEVAETDHVDIENGELVADCTGELPDDSAADGDVTTTDEYDTVVDSEEASEEDRSEPITEHKVNEDDLIDALKDNGVVQQENKHLTRVKFQDCKDEDTVSRNSALDEDYDRLSCYGNEGDLMYDETSATAPVIISFEEIERLKTELAINFSSPQELEDTLDVSDDEGEKWEAGPEFVVKPLPKHHIELLVSVSTPIDGDQESVSFIRIPKDVSVPGLIVPYLVKPASIGSEKTLQSSCTVLIWFQIPKIQYHIATWQVHLLDHKNLKITLLPCKINLGTAELMQSQDASIIRDDGVWHLLTATFYKGAKIRSSSADVLIDLDWKTSMRLDYPCLLDQGNLCLGMPANGEASHISWKLGTVYVFDGALSQTDLGTLYTAGPGYVGNMRSTPDTLPTPDMPLPLLNLSPGACGTRMLDKLLQDLNHPDTKKILMAQEFVTQDNASMIPFKVFPNLSAHLLSQETVPCAVALYNAQPITPSNIGSTFGAIGSEKVLLGLVAMSSDSEGLYAAIKLLTLVVNNNPHLQQDMETSGYEILALLLHRKANIATTHVLQLVASLGACNGTITHPSAVRVLLCCFEIWRNAAPEIQCQLCTCIYNLVVNPRNLADLETMEVSRRLLEFVFDNTIAWSLVQSALEVISAIISTCSAKVLQTFGNYLIYTLPTSLVNEHRLKDVPHVIKIRNMLLELLCVLVQSSDMNNDSKLRLQVEQTLGFDWILLFLRSGLHHITFTMALRLASILVSPANGFYRFSQKANHGGWMLPCSIILPQQQDTTDKVLLGFPLLLHTLKGHTRLPEFSTYSAKLYSWLISLMLNMDQPPSSLSTEFNPTQLSKTFDQHICGVLNKDPLVVILSLVRDDIDDGAFEAVVRYLTKLYSATEIAQTVYITLIELIVSLLWAPYLEPTKDLILKRQCVLDLIEQIILNEIFKQNFDVLDTILEPSNIEFGESLKDYQNVVLHHVLKKMQTGAPDGITTKNFNKAAIFFCKFTLQKLWEGKLGTSTTILECFLHLRDWISKDAEASITYCLHRALLFYLSQNAATVELQKMVLRVIHLLTANHKDIFVASMCDYEFVICLSHLLRSIPTQGEWGKVIEEAAETLLTAMRDLRPDLLIYIEPGSEIPLNSVTKTNKSMISSLFASNEDTHVVLQHEIAPKLFAQIKVQQEEGDKVLHAQRSSRRFTGLLTARRQETQLTITVLSALSIPHEINYAQTTNITCFVSDCFKESVHSTQLQFHRVHRKWDEMQLELTQERGLWGPADPSHLDRWELHHVEGPHRTRKRLKLNADFYKVFQPKSAEDYRLSKFKQPSSCYSKEYFCHYGNRDRVSSLATIGGASKISQLISARTLDADNRLMHDFLRDNESKLHAFPCLRVEGLSTIASLLYCGRKSAYIIDGYTVTKQGDIMDVQMLMPEEWSERFRDILVESASMVTNNRAAHNLDYRNITEIVKRRYSLQENGMEIFCNGGESYFLVFDSNHRNKAYHKLRYLTPSLTQKSDFASDVLSSTRRHTRADVGTVFSNFRQSNVTHRWEVGEITNFQYLMYINTLAGRSYNDLMQYPVFPWILADYDSAELDLTNPKTFRDLSKPMGAQNADRLAQFEKRYNEWVDPHGTDTNPCHYGTFYSSAMITSSYLIRVEPFTSSFIDLQGGHFDLADRLFYSIEDAWRSASEINMCDVRELIPEFFYLPEFLVNRNQFHFGRKQNGEKINDVYLPRWAKGDPAEFIRLHREALESDYVSKHLHNWIDLIFGYKQRGTPAQQASNTFHCYFYEGNIDLSTLTDPLRKSAVKGFINNFGQAPKLIFTRPHPQRAVRYSDMVRRTFHYNVDNLKPPLKEERVISSPVQQIEATDNGGTLFAGKNKVLVPSTAGYNYYYTWGLPDNSLLLGAVDGKIVQVYENLEGQRILCVICPDSKTVLIAGEHSYISVWTHRLLKSKDTSLTLKKNLFGHYELVSCLASSDNHRMFVSGSNDRTVILWDLNNLSFVRQLPKHPHRITAVSMNDVSGEIITAACNHLYLWSINGDLLAHTAVGASPSTVIQVCTQTTCNEWDGNNVLVTGSSDGIVRIWGVLYRKIEASVEGPRQQQARCSVEGPRQQQARWQRTLVMRSRLTMHTSFERADNKHPAEITCLRFSEDHIILYVGDSRGRVYCWAPNDSTGKQADHWVQDSGAKVCKACQVRFTFAERRHHCRHCGCVFCNNCSSFYTPIIARNILHKVRVCKTCFDDLPNS